MPAARLGTTSLVVFGLVLVQPVAPVGVFGLTERLSGGHTTLALLFAMVAMALTASSYGHMAARHPSAGSAYAYAARELSPLVGFLAGWAMALDYLLIPVLSAVYAALTLARLWPAVPTPVWLVGFVVALSLVNLAGLRVSFRAHFVLFVVLAVAVIVFVVAAVVHVTGTRGAAALLAPAGFYDAATFDARGLWRATALGSLTYLGFDAVSTLADEARAPATTVPRAMRLVVLLTGLLGAIEVHLAHLAGGGSLGGAIETAFLDVSARVGGKTVEGVIAAALLVAAAGTFVTAQLGAARLLLAMARDGALPGRWLGRYDERRGVPWVNVVLVGAVAMAGAATLSYERVAELVNFGAFSAFLAVNAASARAALRARRAVVVATSVGGFVFSAAIMSGLAPAAHVVGGAWLVLGFLLAARLARGVRASGAAFEHGGSQHVSDVRP